MLARVRKTGVIVLMFLAGCATDPLSQLETVTPTLSPAQVNDLQKRAQTPEQLGIRAQITQQGASFGDVNILSARETVTLPLVVVPTDKPAQPGGRYRVPVVLATVNGQKNARVLLDSGSNRNLFGYTLARSLGIPIIAGMKALTGRGIGGSVDNYAAIIPTMEIGTVEFRKLVALVGPDAQALSFTRGFWGNTQVMIMGVNTFKGLSYLSVDHLRGSVTFAPTEAYLPEPSSTFITTVPLRWEGELPMVDVTVDKRFNYPCILDTGGDYGMLVPRLAASDLGYWTPGKGELGTARGIGGSSLGTSYNVREVKVGGATFTQVPARTDLIGPQPAGGKMLLGNVVLRRHRVTFDFKHNVLWLER
jgi:hypothetical protein